MRFRPCIDIHDGKVKQIIGGSLDDEKGASENFIAGAPASFYASLYAKKNLGGGHVIILNKAGTAEYEASKVQALNALGAFKGGMSIGGGINDLNAEEFLDAGAYAVIVTSFVFKDGRLDENNLLKIKNAVGSKHLILDLSCRRGANGKLYVVTDRWQRFTELELTKDLLKSLQPNVCEYLIHAADVEGKKAGIDTDVLNVLASYMREGDSVPVTYAGGVHTYEDLDTIRGAGAGLIDATVGSALDLFGGELKMDAITAMLENNMPVPGGRV